MTATICYIIKIEDVNSLAIILKISIRVSVLFNLYSYIIICNPTIQLANQLAMYLTNNVTPHFCVPTRHVHLY